MERIELSKNERKVLRLIYRHGPDSLDTMSRSSVRRALRSLESKYLVRVAWTEGGDYVDVMLTKSAKDYIIENPRLLTPIDWKWWITFITSLIAALGASAGFIALVKTCS